MLSINSYVEPIRMLFSLYGCCCSAHVNVSYTELQNFIFADLRNRAEIALAWIYQEYANFQGYNLVTASAEKPNVASYDECLTRLLNGLLERPDQREG